jgi:site-specific DNA-methyltransferase (adenine-specific)
VTARVLTGDCREIMPTLEADSFDAIVTDAPYELGFMGKRWDSSGVAFQVATWAAALRVAKPGAHLLAFGGTRTYHRLTCAIEDAGWEIRDCLSWLYGSGFPKSLNLDGDWKGWGTALKPAWEPIVLARKPLSGTVAANVETHGTGALNIDGCRIEFANETDERESKDKNRHADFGSGARENNVFGADNRARSEHGNYDAPGRWPPNVALDEEAARLLDEQSGELASGKTHVLRRGATTGKGIGYGSTAVGDAFPNATYGDTGGASRFFYTAKATRKERDAGLEHMPLKKGGIKNDSGRGFSERDPYAEIRVRNDHPTVKPLALMQWLCRLVTPRGGVVLDPFCGSGTTGRAALAEGFGFLGIELEAEYAEIARARIGEYAPLFTEAAS